MSDFEYDFIIVGSGFGGSVSAHRLTEKGYKVAVLEMGKRFQTKDMPKSNWELNKAIWMPSMGLHGMLAITTLKDVVIFHGSGVGGGSLVYANTHLEPLEAFFDDPKWAHLADWRSELKPHYSTAKRMLGSVESPLLTESDRALKQVFDDLGTGDTFKKHTVGVYFGKPGEETPDPYFGGKGPARVGCTRCGACMQGCRIGAKNSLDKNYLYLAEQAGARVYAETKVTDIKPLGRGDGSEGYEVFTTRSTKRDTKSRRRVFRAKRVVLSAGVIGTVGLLSKCVERGSLPHLSDQVGKFVRTNSESIQGVMVKDRDISRGIAITSGGFTPDGTHVELFRYGDSADAMSILTTAHTGAGRLPRQLYFLAALARHPIESAKRVVWPFGWSKGLAGVLAMRATDTSMNLVRRRNPLKPWTTSLTSDWGDREPPPTFMPDVHDLTIRLADKLGGVPGSIAPEVVLNTTTTAHILGGCSMGADASEGVIDQDHQVFGYEGMYVVDGSAVSANLGVNPSLTITALAERAMTKIPNKRQAS